MINIFNRKPNDPNIKKSTLKISGMHCVACGMNIDGELEDTKGVKSAKTSYAKSATDVEFDPKQVSESEIKTIIKNLGYDAE